MPRPPWHNAITDQSLCWHPQQQSEIFQALQHRRWIHRPAVQEEPTQNPLQGHRAGCGALHDRDLPHHHRSPAAGRVHQQRGDRPGHPRAHHRHPGVPAGLLPPAHRLLRLQGLPGLLLRRHPRLRRLNR
ncbi:hypothetical protein RLOC_00007959 [Lonchura striata]|uniref:Uncharacterized protein n=1 Tax=Lonchura striata TaxID=40157 RepID=A0A218U939_9PASE|nr:hypothetical protein RLOC_00007959 [Lonchura striata domestica]